MDDQLREKMGFGTALDRRRIILASALGTVFEWYGFLLYGALLPIFAANFFGDFPAATANIFALMIFAGGFLVKPLGALLFGQVSDRAGRRYTFLATILLMGASTVAVGLLPTAESIGLAAPIILMTLRFVQGLALGGESGGAAIYVAECAPPRQRGFFTSFVQVSAVLGLALSLVAIQLTEAAVGEEAFQSWGWRIPFLLSFILVVASAWVRLQLRESPAFLEMKHRGAESRSPIREALGQWRNARIALVALFGLVAGQAVVTYTGLFYPMFFLSSVLKMDSYTVGVLIAWSVLLGAAGFVAFGWLSDRIGRKPVILGGCLLSALAYFPLFQLMTAEANPALHRAHQTVQVQLIADKATCSFQFNPTGTAMFIQPCDIARMALGYVSANYTTVHEPGREIAAVRVNGRAPISADSPSFGRDLQAALAQAGYPLGHNPSVVRVANPFDVFKPQALGLLGALTGLVLLMAMVFGPIAAALVELFPTRIRYTGMSLPYQLGNGWFGGLLPASALAMNAEAGNIYFGLWYPVAFALLTAGVGLFLVPETHKRNLDRDEATPAAAEQEQEALRKAA